VQGNAVLGTSQMYDSGVLQVWGIQPYLFSDRLLTKLLLFCMLVYSWSPVYSL
jgi:hypothetical protein